ncbi:phosphonate transport system substrate-binding protein [Dyella jiangningensis]|uniref:phosphate/phosphite/phosphonate ABC transporter substrate-binding protein n=1 Tax=Dyella sp. AtDHG13 TaxID=1938897 RepID=UPI0008828103|nr:phosphate/phosphite/phosphonate ABC transporter substrate-binding protein [Dyella sp. AtDHG13]PXV61625.1 phosphonate transport system substrate-binding protein [Dyella sp. AtDHG13]SDJ69225.1 phosphonate transport system substrate-binding protein [Dyella jiangningensis]
METAWRVLCRRMCGAWIRAIWLACLLLPFVSIRADEVVQAPGGFPIRFGILPIGSAAESREQWRPLLEDLERRLGHPVTTVSVSSYAGLSGAIGEQRVDMAFLSGRLAIEAVEHQHMRVVAQFVRSDGAKGNVAMLIVRADGPIRSLKDLLAKPGRWRYARGETLSVTGYVAPEAEVFAPNGLNSDTFFASVRVGNHQNNALAVSNGEVDVATCNNPDLDLFQRNFPSEATQLRVIWRSTLIPSGVLVVREGMPEPLRHQLIDFMRGYGHAPGAAGERERANLARIPDLAGFAAADNSVLRPFVDMEYRLMREQAQHGRWVNDQARKARLTQIDASYQADLKQLLRD